MKAVRPEQNRTQDLDDARCRVEMLGALRVVRAGEDITRFARQKAGMILAYLALFPGAQAREKLVDLFWPEMDLPEGRDNLSTALASLRRQIEPPSVRKGSVIVASHAQVGLNSAAVTTDVADFERLLDKAQREVTVLKRAALLQEVVALYRGDLLPGCYEDWAVRESDRLQARFLSALTTLTQDYESSGALEDARETARRRIAADVYTEDAHFQFIKLAARTGQTVAARDAWERFDKLFQDEYGAGPSAQIRAEIERILANAPRAGKTAQRVPLVSKVTLPVPSPAPVIASQRLPAAPPLVVSRFFGREVEMNGVIHLLLPCKDWAADPEASAPCRLVTLTGPGGIGKTRLALELARRVSDRVPAWCGFVGLAEVTVPERIAERIVSSLGLTPSVETSAIDQIAAFFEARDGWGADPMLLVLDNLEQLLPGDDEMIPETARLVQTLLERSPGLSLLCTSRRRLGLRGERVVPIAPLPVPEPTDSIVTPDDLTALMNVPSVRLYLDRAQAVRPDFALTAANAPAVAALCRHLEGSPLALELAAAWVRTLPPRKMWERLTAGQDIPIGAYADLPARHRSLSAALDWSWRLLPPAQQRLWARLTVFRGGWTADAAADVCEDQDALALLARLEEASLLTVTETDSGDARYGFLETVRAFGGDRLHEMGQSDEVRRRHADFFLTLAKAAEPELRGPAQGEWLERLEEEHDNFRAALEGYLARQDDAATEAGVLLAVTLSRYWSVRGHWIEGERWLSRFLVRPLAALPPPLHARLLNSTAALAKWLGDTERAQMLQEECLALRREIGDLARVADSLHNLGYMAVGQGKLEKARRLYEESLLLCRQLGDTLGEADELHHLGLVAHEQGDFAKARASYEESLILRRPLGDRRGLSNTLYNLGNIALSEGDLGDAGILYEKSLALRREIGDRQGIAGSLLNLSKLSLARGDAAQAQALLGECRTIYQEIGDQLGIATVLEAQGAIALASNAIERGGRLFGAADALRERIRAPHSIAAKSALGESLATIRESPQREEFAAAWALGRLLSWERALDLES